MNISIDHVISFDIIKKEMNKDEENEDKGDGDDFYGDEKESGKRNTNFKNLSQYYYNDKMNEEDTYELYKKYVSYNTYNDNIYHMNILNDYKKKKYDIKIIPFDEDEKKSIYFYLNEIRKIINPYVHSYYNYNDILKNRICCKQLNNSYINVYCPYVLKKHNWLYKSIDNIKLVYDEKVYYLSNLYHAFIFSKNIKYYQHNFNIPPLRLLFLYDVPYKFNKDIKKNMVRKFFFKYINLEKECIIYIKYVFIYLLKYIFLFKIYKYDYKKKTNIDIKNFSINSIPIKNLLEKKYIYYLYREDIIYLENNINQINVYEQNNHFNEFHIYDLLFQIIKPFNVFLNIIKILTIRYILHEHLQNCIITYNTFQHSIFNITDVNSLKYVIQKYRQKKYNKDHSSKQKEDIFKGSNQNELLTNEKDTGEKKQNLIHQDDHLKNRKNKNHVDEYINNYNINEKDKQDPNKNTSNQNDTYLVTNQITINSFGYDDDNNSDSIYSNEYNESSDFTENCFAYNKDNINLAHLQKMFCKKYEKNILNSKYKFLENNLLNNIQKVLKYAFRVPEYVIYLGCTSPKKLLDRMKKVKNVEQIKNSEHTNHVTNSKGDGRKNPNDASQEYRNKENQIKIPNIDKKNVDNNDKVEKDNLLDDIKKCSLKNKKIIEYLKKYSNIWYIDIEKYHSKSIKMLIEKRLNDILRYRQNLYHQLNMKRIDKICAQFLRDNNYIKFSNFYFYCPVDIDNIVDIDTEFLILYNRYLFYFRTLEQINEFVKNPTFYLKQLKPNPSFVLPFIFVYSCIEIENLHNELHKSTKCVVINREHLLSFGNKIKKYEKYIQTNNIDDNILMEILHVRLNQYDILSHGCILYNIPYNKNQLYFLLHNAKKKKYVPHLIFIIKNHDNKKTNYEIINNYNDKCITNDMNVKQNVNHNNINSPNDKDNIHMINDEYKKKKYINTSFTLLSKKKNKEDSYCNLLQFISIIEQEFQEKKYKNIIYIEYSNLWKMKCKITDDIEEKIKSYQKYNRYKYNNKPAYFKGYNIYEKANYEQEIQFNNYCLVTYKKKQILLKCNIYDNYTICHNNSFYLVNSYDDVISFEKNPTEYINVDDSSFKKLEQINNFDTYNNNNNNIPIENEGFCLVSLNDEGQFIKGDKSCCIKYDNKYYIFQNKEKMQTFINNYNDYLNNQNIFDIILNQLKNKNDLNTLIYLKTYLYEILCHALYELGKHRPIYPGLTIQLSAIKFLALFFYKENKLFSIPLRKTYEQNYQTFLTDCDIPIHIQKLKQKFKNNSTNKNQTINTPVNNWTKRDIEKYHKYINLYDKILYSQTITNKTKQKKIKYT